MTHHSGTSKGACRRRRSVLLSWQIVVTATVQRRLESNMRHYEVMVILDPSLDERTVAPSLDQFLTVVRNDGGTVEKVDVWGRRRLAYDIDKKSEGIYAVIDLSAEPATVKELSRQMNLNEGILR